jgi:hypothetical protein
MFIPVCVNKQLYLSTKIICMNKSFYQALLAGLMLLLASCTKESNTNVTITSVVTNNPVGEAIGGAPAIPSTAYGAFYAINQVVTDTGRTTKTGSAYAWLGSDTVTYKADAVTCAGDSLITNGSFPWYETVPGVANGFGDSTVWDITGSRTLAGFTYADKTPFPTVTNYALPQSISVSSPLVVTFSVSNPFDVIVFTLGGSKGVVSQNATTAGSVTFSVQQIGNATANGDTHVSLQIMAIKTTAFGIGNKTYYFVRQYANKQFTTAGP